MRTYTEQFATQTNRPALRQVWIWVREPEGAHLEARWVDDSQLTSREAREPEPDQIEACLEGLESAA